MKSHVTLTEKTTLPISLVIVAISVAIWLIRLEGRVDAQAQTTTRLDSDRTEVSKVVKRIDRRLSNIEGRLGLPTSDKEE
jgi:hypothetical protein